MLAAGLSSGPTLGPRRPLRPALSPREKQAKRPCASNTLADGLDENNHLEAGGPLDVTSNADRVAAGVLIRAGLLSAEMMLSSCVVMSLSPDA